MKQILSSVLLCLVCTAGQVAAQQIRGRVVDEPTRQAIRGAEIRLLAPDSTVVSTTTSDARGFFVLPIVARGRYRVTAQAPSFAPRELNIEITGDSLLLPALVLVPQAIPLDPIDVATRAEREAPNTTPGTARQVLSGSRLAKLDEQGVTALNAARQLPGLRTRNLKIFRTADGRTHNNYVCLESTRKMASMSGPPAACVPVLLVLNGVMVGDPFEALRSMTLGEVESIELVGPVQAGQRYGLDASASGALEIWTRGKGPHKSAERNR